MRLVLPALVVCTAILSGELLAQDPFGTFATRNEAGAAVTLTLVSEADGQVSGTFASSQVTYTASAVYEDGTVLGTLSGDTGGVYFAAGMVGGQLQLTLYEADLNNQPNYATAQTLMLQRAAATPAPSVAGAERAGAGGAASTAPGKIPPGRPSASTNASQAYGQSVLQGGRPFLKTASGSIAMDGLDRGN